MATDTIAMTIYVDKYTAAALKIIKKKRGCTMTWFISTAIAEKLSRERHLLQAPERVKVVGR